MNKTVLKNFAINSRLELLARVRDRAALYGLTEEKCKSGEIVDAESFLKVDGNLLSKKETEQRKALAERIRNNGFVQVMEEAAYTWFNRFIALRYMEEHNLLPIDMRVIPQKAGELPQIVREAQNMSIEGIDFSVVLQFLDENKSEELYKYLIIALCNNLSAWLPQMFEKINDYTELLFPDGLLKSDSFLGMLANVGEDNWQDIQVIGWMYQYYNTELKDETFALLKKNVKITKDRIGAATQLFTPEWIVRYMVENSLGRLWYEGHPDDSLKANWKYYLDEAKQETEVEEQLKQIREERKKLKPEEIKLLDPCMGSGHILVYAFDVLMQIYRSIGYTDRDAVKSIVENNLYGLDIDDRAAQLAYFALMMKAAEYDKRFLKRGIQPNVCAIQESNTLSEFAALQGQISLDKTCINTANQLIGSFVDAKEYGSILSPHVENNFSVDLLIEQLKDAVISDLEVSSWLEKARKLLPQLAEQAKILQQKYDIVITNPPYMGSTGMGNKLNNFVKDFYPNSKSDLFAVFIERILDMLKNTGYQAMITQHSWMFLTSYEKLRTNIIKYNLLNMAHLGTRAFEDIGGEVVQTTSFIICNRAIKGYNSKFVRLIDASAQEKEAIFLSGKQQYVTCQDLFKYIPGFIYAYWHSTTLITKFSTCNTLSVYGETRKGLSTSDNTRFIRLWHEIGFNKVKFGCSSPSDTFCDNYKWYPYVHGGVYRKWYPTFDSVVNFSNDAKEIKETVMRKYPYLRNPDFVVKKTEIYFVPGIIWNDLADVFNAKYMDKGYIYSDVTPSYIPKEAPFSVLAYFNSIVFSTLASVISQGMHYSTGHIPNIPFIPISKEIDDIVSPIVKRNIELVKDDEDSFETSWSFVSHPLVKSVEKTKQTNKAITISETFSMQTEERQCCFNELKANEEKLNSIFIEYYSLQEELTPEVADKDVTVRKADLGRDIRSLISYAVGCMFGRYSLDTPGLAYAGGEWDPSKYVTYPADKDGILPITDDEYFQDDIVSMFIRWVKTVYGEETLEENLQFIANALNPSGASAREVIRSYFLNDFYADHLKIYQKRPIYWQFDSGKQNGFKALMYLHRYDQDTVARLRTDYVHELQDRYRTQLDDARQTAETGDARQRSIASKRAQKLDKQLTELNKYEELVHHYADMRIPLDLDDGVKVNYAKLQEILTKIK